MKPSPGVTAAFDQAAAAADAELDESLRRLRSATEGKDRHEANAIIVADLLRSSPEAWVAVATCAMYRLIRDGAR